MIESWDSFFVAETAAAAALLGLLFVSVSINLKDFIAAGGLADRALAALTLLLAMLIIGLVLAMPGQPVAAMGGETILGGLITVVAATIFGLRGLRVSEAAYRANFARNIVTSIAAIAPIVIGGFLMLDGGAAGFYFVAAGMCLAILKAVTEGWIFLVEVNR
jgi:modulator of FtsH protease